MRSSYAMPFLPAALPDNLSLAYQQALRQSATGQLGRREEGRVSGYRRSRECRGAHPRWTAQLLPARAFILLPAPTACEPWPAARRYEIEGRPNTPSMTWAFMGVDAIREVVRGWSRERISALILRFGLSFSGEKRGPFAFQLSPRSTTRGLFSYPEDPYP
ncbi:hypothetical protein Shyd_81980 [Streptomyces hydrogenans]|uniref:Uncharacterized protein n=1 Tax=Streptomyces hydrogenans TaxID=1873719 RepID=A0ABQ3P655_9ACTN|nr:hypothetical protein GCM10018784_56030 [Streptomyces hydrogenans]GHI20347.1 hypothetical protein Shyd_17180 [Streptomyces hydrogenans]GHI20470.1 hypothetical protein Shyd_18410 [Streptomyces hydrogenans]GHI20485.1 hypothetical protein Shyd_18560 [Streptomyces hydrogenans]GHI22945.1 hypothetical protein Shyd_43160 [Streptomyces hydrogenans]